MGVLDISRSRAAGCSENASVTAQGKAILVYQLAGGIT